VKLYVSGPMDGYPDKNLEVFEFACKALQFLGHETVSPHDIGLDTNDAYSQNFMEPKTHDYLRADLRAMLECEGIVLLPGWSQSKGAIQELNAAVASGLYVFYWRTRAYGDQQLWDEDCGDFHYLYKDSTPELETKLDRKFNSGR